MIKVSDEVRSMEDHKLEFMDLQMFDAALCFTLWIQQMLQKT